ncbi:hypothetical protein Q652_01599 [Bartonella henselae JK 41]|nr:hypothetical protein Q652_01599 [Bartonella henselae JK 41]
MTPTFALDDTISAQIVEHLYKLSQERIILVITHKPNLFPQHATILNFTDLKAKKVNKTSYLCPLSLTLHMVVTVLISLFLFIVIGIFIKKTEIVARGQGAIIPTTYIQLVQVQNTGPVLRKFL